MEGLDAKLHESAAAQTELQRLQLRVQEAERERDEKAAEATQARGRRPPSCSPSPPLSPSPSPSPTFPTSLFSPLSLSLPPALVLACLRLLGSNVLLVVLWVHVRAQCDLCH